MNDKPNRSIKPSSGGIFTEITLRGKLILRLMADKRVSPLLKLLPIGTVVYLFFPDLLPGPVDDAAIIWLGTYAFVEMCPPDVVEEHMRRLAPIPPVGSYEEPGSAQRDDSVIDADFQDLTGDPRDPRGGNGP